MEMGRKGEREGKREKGQRTKCNEGYMGIGMRYKGGERGRERKSRERKGKGKN
jgi:hypothetical protein